VRTVEAEVVRPSTIERRVRLVGTVRGENEALVFPDMGGRLLKLNVREGQYVRRGQVVALIDRSAPGFDVKPLTVIAPASGYVQLLVRDVGTTVGRDKPLMRIVSKRRLKVSVAVPEAYASKIRRGTEMYAEGIPVRVSSVSPVLDPKSRTLPVEGVVSGPFIPGQSVLVELVVERRDSVKVLPASALVGGVRKGVFVYGGGKVRYVPVKLGLTTAERVEILDGIDFGDTVVVFGASTLKDGQRVKITLRESSEPSSRP